MGMARCYPTELGAVRGVGQRWGWVGVGGLILSRNLYMFPTYREIIIYKDNGESWVCTENANLIANNR